MNEERDSQLSAMFDGELPGAECELLARRLTRDEALRAQWSRFSMIGAALRAERGVALHDRVAWRVQSQVAQDPTYGDGTVDTAATSTHAAVVAPASVKAAAPLAAFRSTGRWRQHCRRCRRHVHHVAAHQDAGPEQMLASNPVTESIVLTPEATGTTVALNDGACGSATCLPMANPTSTSRRRRVRPTSIAPPARLANYVVAHSEYSGPLSRRMALLGLVATDPESVTPVEPNDAAAGAADAP